MRCFPYQLLARGAPCINWDEFRWKFYYWCLAKCDGVGEGVGVGVGDGGGVGVGGMVIFGHTCYVSLKETCVLATHSWSPYR